MARKFSGSKLVIASHNKGKIVEIRELLGAYVGDIVSAGDLGLPEPDETGTTFIANAELKARASAIGSAAADRSSTASGGAMAGSTRWRGSPCRAITAVRKLSCRAARPASASRTRASSTEPSSARAPRML